MTRLIVPLTVALAALAGAGEAAAQKQPNVSDIATCNKEAEAAAFARGFQQGTNEARTEAEKRSAATVERVAHRVSSAQFRKAESSSLITGAGMSSTSSSTRPMTATVVRNCSR